MSEGGGAYFEFHIQQGRLFEEIRYSSAVNSQKHVQYQNSLFSEICLSQGLNTLLHFFVVVVKFLVLIWFDFVRLFLA